MDAADVEGDVRLYKASGELLSELQAKIPLLLNNKDGRPRKCVLFTKTSELTKLLDSFQDWPQLLDPILAKLIEQLTSAFLHYCKDSRSAYKTSHQDGIEPVPRSICRLLYAFCKVRGYKTVTRLLGNEPKFVEPIVLCLQYWDDEPHVVDALVWEERYIMQLWLAHLMLAPFDLANISITTSKNYVLPPSVDDLALPPIAITLSNIAFKRLFASSKDREAASMLMVRLSLRGDMQKIGLLHTVIDWVITQLQLGMQSAENDHYRTVGLLTLMFGVINSASSSEAAPFLQPASDICSKLIQQALGEDGLKMSSAPSRKLLIKNMRVILIHALALSDAGSDAIEVTLESMLETSIQALLELLGDSDTPVRQTASKALGTIMLKLDPDMGGEVLEAVLSSLNDDILLEDILTGQLNAATDLINIDATKYRKNYNAVNSLKWHGYMLTLGHALFRRSPPPEKLSSLLQALIQGLKFEQRSAVGTSIGVAVRDAACFGLWALARKYSTEEISKAQLGTNMSSRSALQIIANELVVASCLDPSGNLRRGASAALQELIGRHPDTIENGIFVVQQVDYHAVASRLRAMKEVTMAVSEGRSSYRSVLMSELLGWRGCGAVDALSRRHAAQAASALFESASQLEKQSFVQLLLDKITRLRKDNNGANASARHGLLSCMAGTFAAFPKDSKERSRRLLLETQTWTGCIDGRISSDLILVLEASASLIKAVCQAQECLTEPDSSSEWMENLRSVLDRCTTASDDEILCEKVAEANALYFLLPRPRTELKAWLSHVPSKKTEAVSKGRVYSLAAISGMSRIGPDVNSGITSFLCAVISSDQSIDVKVYTMTAISSILHNQEIVSDLSELLTSAIVLGLDDYTNDQRGDVGSLLRLQSIDTARKYLQFSHDEAFIRPLLASLVRLSLEKMTKVRYQAWSCLLDISGKVSNLNFEEKFQHQADISSLSYYLQLISLIRIDWLSRAIVDGLTSAVAGGSEDASRAAGFALVLYLSTEDKWHAEETFTKFIANLLERLSGLASREDREVLPTLEMLCFILEQASTEQIYATLRNADHILQLRQIVDSLQSSKTDIARVQAIVRLQTVLSSSKNTRHQALDNITRKLLNKWPKVRQSAIDNLYLIAPEAVNMNIDWNMSPSTNKSEVTRVRKAVGVMVNSAAKPE